MRKGIARAALVNRVNFILIRKMTVEDDLGSRIEYRERLYSGINPLFTITDCFSSVVVASTGMLRVS